ncbi:hypothetical protein GCM10009076_15190 [Erythrobacter ramosus]
MPPQASIAGDQKSTLDIRVGAVLIERTLNRQPRQIAERLTSKAPLAISEAYAQGLTGRL